MRVSLDVETTTKNKGHPFNPDNFLVSFALTTEQNTRFAYYKDPEFLTVLKETVHSCTEWIGFNAKFDLHWVRRVLALKDFHFKIWDCQLAEFVLNSQQGAYLSLNEALKTYGLGQKIDKVKEYWDAGISTEDIPVDVLEEYNKDDAVATMELYHLQQSLMTPAQRELVYLLGEDMKTLIECEANGIKWNKDGAFKKVEEINLTVAEYERYITAYLPPINFGVFNFDSGVHLSCLLYGGSITFDYAIPENLVYKSGANKGLAYTRNRWFEEKVEFQQLFRPIPDTELKKTKEDKNPPFRLYSTDDSTLSQLKTRRSDLKELIDVIRKRSAVIKVKEMIEGIQKKSDELNWVDQCIHAQFNQNVVVTGRLSSSSPNMQNTPAEVDEFLVSRYE